MHHLSLCIHDRDHEPFRSFEFISAEDRVHDCEDQTLICFCDCKVCLASLLAVTFEIFLWLST